MSSAIFRGLGVCPGIAFGRVHVVDRRRVSIPRYHVPRERIEAELERFERAVDLSERQFAELMERAHRGRLTEVEKLLKAHALMLRDTTLWGATRDRIQQECLNAEWALKEALRRIEEVFDGLEEDYFRERRTDVDMVGDRILRNLVGAETELLANLSEDAVVVAYDLSPADTVALARYAAKAFVTETGGRTSHIAILARAMSIPAVLGVHGIMDRVGFGDPIVVDGRAGEVVLDPSEAATAGYRTMERRRAKEEAALLGDRDLSAETLDGVRVQLLGNIEVAEEIKNVVAHGGEGIGLYRTEFLVIERHRMPSAEEHAATYREVVQAIDGREVTIRTIDIGGDKFLRAKPSGLDRRGSMVTNPALGLRAIRYSLRDPATFKDQLRAILEASAIGCVRVLFPFVTGVGEIRHARQILEDAKRELDAAGLPYDPHLPVGVMVETPAAVWIADLLAKEADFFAIGTNDLIQYAFAVDRGNDDVAYLYRPADPAVLRMIRAVCDVAEKRAVPLNVCGEMAGDPFHLPLLIGLGARSLSMSAQSIPLVKRLLRRVRITDCQALVREALERATAQEVEDLLGAWLHARTPDLFPGVQAKV